MISEDNSAPAPEAFAMEPDDASDVEMETVILPSRCAFLTQPHTAIVEIDKQGDIILLVGEHRCEVKANGDHVHTKAVGFRVCSSTLARASPVLKAMLFGKFWEATQTTIKLPEDDPKAMKMLLYLIHGDTARLYRFTNTRRKLACCDGESVDRIYQIVALADKYVMTRHLRPFAPTWCDTLIAWDDGMRLGDGTPVYYQRLEKCLAVASQFGHLELFETVYRPSVWVMQRDQDLFRHVLEPDGVAGKVLCFPFHHLRVKLTAFVPDHLRSGRICILDEYLIPVRNMINALKTGMDPTGLYLCKQEDLHARRECQAYTLEVMIQRMKSESIWPLPYAEDIVETPQNFGVRIEKSIWGVFTPLHNECNIQTEVVSQCEAGPHVGRHSTPSKEVLLAMLHRARDLDWPDPGICTHERLLSWDSGSDYDSEDEE